ncbi:hypothetical protein B0H17DRAFT_1149170 [Mycena rosella]|uniref:glucan 1,3-beta-glucosidase n=1 Tax=Mycena rosella TaxID=1033263 RepID=A0AAD7FVT1_MYCRO|nr:hypothetical protein B0H17DRAFT_1149170 [Mycena rosella]
MQEREHDNPFMAPYATPSQHSQQSLYSDHPQAPYASPYGAYTTDSQLTEYRDDPVYPPASPNNSAHLLPTGASAENAAPSRSYGASYVPGARGAAASRTKRRWIGLGVVAGIIVVAVAVVLPVYFLVIKKHNDAASGTASGGSGAGGSKGVVGAVTGGDGSTVVTANGSSFVYNNSFGGYWAWDAANPFGSGGRPNSWTPPLNESWDWANDKIYGVNLGGWFVLEPSDAWARPGGRRFSPLIPARWHRRLHDPITHARRRRMAANGAARADGAGSSLTSMCAGGRLVARADAARINASGAPRHMERGTRRVGYFCAAARAAGADAGGSSAVAGGAGGGFAPRAWLRYAPHARLSPFSSSLTSPLPRARSLSFFTFLLVPPPSLLLPFIFPAPSFFLPPLFPPFRPPNAHDTNAHPVRSHHPRALPGVPLRAGRVDARVAHARRRDAAGHDGEPLRHVITEQDIAQIAGAGLNWVRVPIPFWAVSTWSDVGTDGTGEVAEPFLESVCWKYVVRLLGWARKYGLRVNLDLHTVPGSQNGYNHSGKLGQVNFLNGIMGVANAQRALDYIRTITEFISQPEWRDVVPMFGIVNEALMSTIGRDQLTAFYLHAHDMIRGITGLGAGNGPFISVHDGFDSVASWAGLLPGSDRIILDKHPYFAFDQQPTDAPIATSDDPASAGGVWPKQACSAWGPPINTSRCRPDFYDSSFGDRGMDPGSCLAVPSGAVESNRPTRAGTTLHRPASTLYFVSIFGRRQANPPRRQAHWTSRAPLAHTFSSLILGASRSKTRGTAASAWHVGSTPNSFHSLAVLTPSPDFSGAALAGGVLIYIDSCRWVAQARNRARNSTHEQLEVLPTRGDGGSLDDERLTKNAQAAQSPLARALRTPGPRGKPESGGIGNEASDPAVDASCDFELSAHWILGEDDSAEQVLRRRRIGARGQCGEDFVTLLRAVVVGGAVRMEWKERVAAALRRGGGPGRETRMSSCAVARERRAIEPRPQPKPRDSERRTEQSKVVPGGRGTGSKGRKERLSVRALLRAGSRGKDEGRTAVHSLEGSTTQLVFHGYVDLDGTSEKLLDVLA